MVDTVTISALFNSIQLNGYDFETMDPITQTNNYAIAFSVVPVPGVSPEAQSYSDLVVQVNGSPVGLGTVAFWDLGQYWGPASAGLWKFEAQSADGQSVFQLYFSTITNQVSTGAFSTGNGSLQSGDVAVTSFTGTFCFMAGTRIQTPGGWTAVENLRRGDMVLTADGRAEPVEWLGVQTVATRFADPLRVLPIRIKAGALAENLPCRDLLLSPDHALLIGNVLIHAGALVNGGSIVRESQVPPIFSYFHVELADHALIVAEGVAAETFVDNADRLAFENWAEHAALYPAGKPIAEMPYPRAKAARQVPLPIRKALALRQQALVPEWARRLSG